VTAGRRNQWRERTVSARRRATLSPLPGQLAAARAEPAALRARRRVITATGISGAGLLAASLSATAGSRQFYLLTAGLAATWAGGALAAGPLPSGRTPDHDHAPHRLGLVVFLAAERFSAGAGLRSAVVSPVEDHPAGGPCRVKRALTPVPPLPHARCRPVPGLAGACARRSRRGANLSQADLRGANLSAAILEDTVLSGAQADTSTIWPTDFNAQRRRELGVIEVGDNSLA
jgi:uncharacterized protein YjbI with pentapeptide repeats